MVLVFCHLRLYLILLVFVNDLYILNAFFYTYFSWGFLLLIAAVFYQMTFEQLPLYDFSPISAICWLDKLIHVLCVYHHSIPKESTTSVTLIHCLLIYIEFLHLISLYFFIISLSDFSIECTSVSEKYSDSCLVFGLA